MSLIKCPECGKDISDEAKACPNCGHPLQPKSKKKSPLIIVLAIIGGVIALFVCISALSDLKKASSIGKISKATNISTTKKETKSVEIKEAKQPKVDFTKATDEEIVSLPDLDGLIEAVVVAAKSIGVSDFVESEFGNYEKVGDVYINISAKCETETGTELIIDSMYVTGYTSKWTTSSIIDYNTGNYYFVSDNSHDFVDLYDYKTGKLISEKTKNFDDYDALDEFNKRCDEIDEEFQKSLNEISEKYTNAPSNKM